MPKGPSSRPSAARLRHSRPKACTPGFVAVGRIVAPWGLRGDVKVEPLTDFPERFQHGSSLWLEGRRLHIQRSRWHAGFVYLGLDGITSRQEAEGLRDGLLEVPETELSPLAEGQYYHFQIIGLEVFTGDGRRLGYVEDILPTGANDVLVVRGPAGETLLPAIDDVVRQLDLATRRMVVEPLEEM